MSLIKRTATGFCLALSIITPLLAHGQSSPKADIRTSTGNPLSAATAALDTFRSALTQGDGAKVLSLLADNVLIYEGGYVERSKAEYANTHLKADMEFAKTTQYKLVSRTGQAAGALVILQSEGRTTGRYHDKDIDEQVTETVVLRQIQGQWRITHVHWSAHPNKK